MEGKLKPCPFCGGEATMQNAGGYPGMVMVACTSCGINTGMSIEPVVVQRWNRRAMGERRAKPARKYIDMQALGIGRANPDIFLDKAYAAGWNAVVELLNDAPAANVVPVDIDD